MNSNCKQDNLKKAAKTKRSLSFLHSIWLLIICMFRHAWLFFPPQIWNHFLNKCKSRDFCFLLVSTGQQGFEPTTRPPIAPPGQELSASLWIYGRFIVLHWWVFSLVCCSKNHIKATIIQHLCFQVFVVSVLHHGSSFWLNCFCVDSYASALWIWNMML